MSSGRGRALIGWVLVPYLLHVVLRLLLASDLDCPLKTDELVYLGNARYLATGSGLVDPTGRNPFKVGYSLFLIPAFLFAGDPAAGFKATQVINAFLLSLVYPAAFFLAGRLRRDLPPPERMLVALCVSLYPAALLYATTAMSANAFLPAYFLYLLAGLSALSRPRWWSWAGFGVGAAYLYAVHERAIGILAVTLATAILYLLSGRRRRRTALAALAALPAAVALLRLVEVPGSRYRTGATGLQVLQRALADPETLLVTAAGQLWYLGLATFGALFLGTLCLRLRRGGSFPGSAPPRLFWPLVYGSAASVFALSVLFLSQQPEARFTHWIHGRYNEGVLLPLLLVALLALRDLPRRRVFAGGALATLAVIGLSTLVINQAWTPEVGPPFSFSASSIPLFVKPLGWGILRSTAVWGVGFLLVTALFAHRWRWGLVGLSLLFVLSAAVSYADTWVARYRATENQRELARLVERIDPPRREAGPRKVILHQVTRGSYHFHFHYHNLAYFLPQYEFRRLGKRTLGSSDLVLSSRLDFGRSHPGARLAGLENLSADWTGYLQGLWVLPGTLQETLAGRGWLLPADFPGRLDGEVLRSELRLQSFPPPPREALPEAAARRWRPGERRTLRLEVDHRGSAPWPQRKGLGTREHSVRLTAAWIPAGGGEAAARQWANLPRMLYPGESAPIEIRLRAAGADGPLPAGAYRILLAIAQERQGEPESLAAEGLEIAAEVGE